jgi:hypothetical protein
MENISGSGNLGVRRIINGALGPIKEEGLFFPLVGFKTTKKEICYGNKIDGGLD